MTAALTSLSSAGSIPIKLPTVAVNTTDRASITAGLTAVFGSKLVPIPNYSGNPATFPEAVTPAKSAQLAVLRAEEARMLALRKEAEAVSDKAIAEFKTAKNNLPQGDPELERLRLVGLTLLNASVDAYLAWSKARDAANDYDFFGKG